MQLVKLVDRPFDDPLDVSILQLDAEDDLLAEANIDF